MTTCKTHGELAWKGHVQCSSCGAAYTTRETSRVRLPTHAPARCQKCRARLMPVIGRRHVEYTAIECCAACFAEAKGYTFDDGHDRGDPVCKGLECPFHGPMLKKFARRAKASGSEMAKKYGFQELSENQFVANVDRETRSRP